MLGCQPQRKTKRIERGVAGIIILPPPYRIVLATITINTKNTKKMRNRRNWRDIVWVVSKWKWWSDVCNSTAHMTTNLAKKWPRNTKLHHKYSIAFKMVSNWLEMRNRRKETKIFLTKYHHLLLFDVNIAKS